MRAPVSARGLWLGLALALAACQGDENDLVEVRLSPATVALAPGESQVVQATVICSFDPCDGLLALTETELPIGLQVDGLSTPPQGADGGRTRVWSLTLTASAEAPAFDGALGFSARTTDGQSYASRFIEVLAFRLALRISGQPGSAPVARFAYSPALPVVGQPIAFDATASTGSITGYRWDFGDDGSVEATGPTATYSFGVAGPWRVRLQLVGADGMVATATQTLVVGDGAGAGEAVLTLSFTGSGRGGVTFTPAVTACSRDGEPVCSRNFPAASNVVLKAFAYEGSRLRGWGPGCSAVNPDGDECTVFMDGNRQITLQID